MDISLYIHIHIYIYIYIENRLGCNIPFYTHVFVCTLFVPREGRPLLYCYSGVWSEQILYDDCSPTPSNSNMLTYVVSITSK